MADVVGSDGSAEAAGAGEDVGQAADPAAGQGIAGTEGMEGADGAADIAGAAGAAAEGDGEPAAEADLDPKAGPETAAEPAGETDEAAAEADPETETGAEPADEADEPAAEADSETAAESESAAEEPVVAPVSEPAAQAPEAGSEGAQKLAQAAVTAVAAFAPEAVAETIVAPVQAPPVAPIAAAFPEPPQGPAFGAAAEAPAASAVPAAPSTPTSGLGLDRRKALIAGGVGVVVVGAATAAYAASGGSGSSPSAASGSKGAAAAGTSSAAAKAAAIPLPTITTVPANGATGVDPSKPITVQVLGGQIDSVSLSGQDQTNGTLSTDGSSWTSANVLSVDASYRLTVSAKNSAGKTTSTAISFQTLKPSATFGVDSVVPPRGSTVGVGQPIRVTFSNYVPDEYKSALEKACVVTTDPPVAGAWYWVSNGTGGAVVDWRPEAFWAVNTKVSIGFNLDGVRLGEHQYGVENYAAHDFTISSRDLRLIVDKDKFEATCYQDGRVIRSFPIDTGQTTAETFVTYTGTMAVLGKGNPVEMKGNYGGGDVYDDFVNWATQITWSGTYVHAAPWDPDIGSANDDSHGCVHCRTVDAEWYYGVVIDGDVVTINGSRARAVAVDNGICTFTLDWPTLLKGSAYGPTINGKPTSA